MRSEAGEKRCNLCNFCCREKVCLYEKLIRICEGDSYCSGMPDVVDGFQLFRLRRLLSACREMPRSEAATP